MKTYAGRRRMGTVLVGEMLVIIFVLLSGCAGSTAAVTSPTFTFRHRYPVLGGAPVEHLDLYRIDGLDELAELDADAMALLERLARMGRAEGIILIAVTQRPSADVLGGLDARTHDDGAHRAGCRWC